jgi:hypothetical protein
MTMNRHGFLVGSTAAVAGAGLACEAEGTVPQPPSEAELRHFGRSGVIPGKEPAKKLAWLVVLSLSFLLGTSVAITAERPLQRPNILFILADDK